MLTAAAPKTIVNGRRLHRWAALALLVAASALLASAFVAGTPPDEEEFRYAVLTSWLHVRALSEGSYAFWTSLLGFGLPQPFVPNFWFHPLLPLLAVLEPSTWVRMLLVVHTIVGATGMWHLCRVLALRPMVRAICASTFLLAAPAMNYALTDAWPSHWIVWTSMPWLVLSLWRVLDGDSHDQWLCGTLLGLGTGLVIANANPAYAIVYGVLVAAAIVSRWRSVAERWRVLSVSALIALVISAPNAALIVSERGFFAPGLRLANNVSPLPLSAVWDVFLRPLSRSNFPWLDVVPGDGRTLFFGGPFAVLCLVACFQRGWHRRELVLGLAIALAFLFTALGPISLVSQRYQFRDPVILCAIPLAGIAAERGLQNARVRRLTAVLLVLQVAVLVLTAYPFLSRSWNADSLGTPWFRGATAAVPPVDILLSALERPDRVLYSPRVDRGVMNHTYLRSGLGVNGLAYRGVHLVNGWFKGVSADPIWPDERLFYARVAPPQALLESGVALDVLGIRYVLAERGETVAPDLRERAVTIPTAPELVLYENEDARAGAFIVDQEAVEIHAPPFSNCANDRLLCRDLSAVARLQPGRVADARSEGVIDVTFDRSEKPRTLVVTEMFRPAWVAIAGDDNLPTFAFLDSLLAVRVPGGTTSVHLAYRPRLLLGATVAAWAAIAGSLLAVVAVLIGSRRHAQAAGVP